MKNIVLKINFIFCLFIVFHSVAAQISLRDNVYKLKVSDNDLTIDDVLVENEKGNFDEPFKIETYKFIKGKEAQWLRIDIPKVTEINYFSIENSLFEELSFYQKYREQVALMNNLKDDGFYRFPIVKILPEQTPCEIFVRFKDQLSFRTEFNSYVFNEKTFSKQQQKDYFVIGGYVLGILVLLISASALFFYKRNFAILWYVAHLSLLIVEYLISTGAFSQWFVSNEFILKYGLDHISMMWSTMALSEFFRAYYNYTNGTKFCRSIYLGITIVCFLGGVYAITDGFMGNIYNVEYYSQTVFNFASIITLVIHFVLLQRKVIPWYLFIAFLFPLLGIYANTGDFKYQFDNPNITYFLFQSVYLGILLELIVLMFYIIKQSVDKELEAISLEEENEKLKNEFHEEIFSNQERQQNAIVSDVHDSFGGYLEALKLHLETKNILTPDVEKILHAFRKDYRFLLNSLYVPNINSENFLSSIEDYCERMNGVTSIDIKLITGSDWDIAISQNIAKYIFKASSELTTNALKYSNASTVEVKLYQEKGQLILEVRDNGIGFDTSKITTSSFGLKGLQERAHLLKGSFLLESQEDKGSLIIVRLPL